ncbi:MAG TPA: flagellar hook assembly protein FlgD [Holophaga sp.]|nr:flagellar hook assembly protein FlgD [Holophaga sp.]HPS68436.1 flagellar hook assembly protein FlgD [Holophaga sp.]
METGAVTNTSTTDTTKKASSTLDKEAFLKLLAAQLENQDPTAAQDTNQMVQQMTSYAQLEQAQNTNSLLEGMQLQNQSLFQAQAANMIGKKIRVATSDFELAGGKASVDVDLAAKANVVLTIKNSEGRTVATVNEGSQAIGSHTFEWDGKSSSGATLADGTYTVEVTAKDSTGAKVKTQTTQEVTVKSVAFVNGAAVFMAGNHSYYFSDILQFSA